LDIIKKNINKIIFNINISSINFTNIKCTILKNIQFLNISLNCNEKDKDIDITYFDNLINLSVTSLNDLKLILSKNQYQNIKVLKIVYYNFKDENKFQNLEELSTYHINLNHIHFNSSKLKKLDLIINEIKKCDQYYT